MQLMQKYQNNIIVVTIVAAIYSFSIYIGYPIGCIIYAITGLNCPTCGMTRAWLALLSGDIEMAFYFHPLFMFVPIVLGLYFFNHEFWGKKKFVNVIIYTLLAIYIAVYIVRMFGLLDMFLPLDNRIF